MFSTGVPSVPSAPPGSKIWGRKNTHKSFLLVIYFCHGRQCLVKAVSQRDPEPAVPKEFLTSTLLLWNKWTSLAIGTLPARVPGLCVGVEIESHLSTARVCFQLFCCNPDLVSSSCPHGLSLEDDTEKKCQHIWSQIEPPLEVVVKSLPPCTLRQLVQASAHLILQQPYEVVGITPLLQVGPPGQGLIAIVMTASKVFLFPYSPRY